ncbi:uncharacterized protein T28D9.3 [Copidosoma floridanum]|uniref:uncharacterized protein T28D9.3 n=1 Tax=Copidosoma floridanum TaxID=29053 RepID=UPI0006C97F73|nr:uncharacterized protein T28D9.3 [Copidosoma floridanum]
MTAIDQTDKSKVQIFRKAAIISINLVIAIIVLLVIWLAEFGFVPNRQGGFFCNDPNISHKFRGETISSFIAMSVAVLLPALMMLLTEYLCHSPDSHKLNSRKNQLWLWYGYFAVGCIYMYLVVQVLKLVVSEPRPHFIDSCRPTNIESCTTSEFISSYTCTNTEISPYLVKDSDRSFPSGHSATSMFMTTYLVWYLQRRMPETSALVLLKPGLQCLAVMWGLVCSMSRITDHRHHWWDVLIGAIIGIVFACFVVRVLCRSFRLSPSPLSCCRLPTNPDSVNVDLDQSKIVIKMSSNNNMDNQSDNNNINVQDNNYSDDNNNETSANEPVLLRFCADCGRLTDNGEPSWAKVLCDTCILNRLIALYGTF